MRLISVLGKDLPLKIPGRAPHLHGQEEYRFPCRSVMVISAVKYVGFAAKATVEILNPLPVLDIADKDAAVVLETLGRMGVVAVEPNEGLDDAVRRALLLRLDFVRHQLTSYRENQAARQASGMEILLPRAFHRDYLREMHAVNNHGANDPVLTEDISFGMQRPVAQPAPDPMAAELASFGISPETAPMIPGRGIDAMLNLAGDPNSLF